MIVHTPVVVHTPRRGRFLGFLIPLVLSIGITAAVFVSTSQSLDAFSQFGELGELLDPNALSGTGNTGFQVHSGRPLASDLDGDGTEDIVLVVRSGTDQQLLARAFSGTDWKKLWETPSFGSLSSLSGQLGLWLHEDTVLIASGTALHAHDAKTGARRFTATLPDRIAKASANPGKVIVETIDEKLHLIDLKTGAVAQAATHGRPLAGDEGFEQIPDDERMDLEYDAFKSEGLDVDGAFCPRELRLGPTECEHPRGVAVAMRNKGSRVPYVVGYDRKTKAILWKSQVTPEGSVATADGGMGPRVEVLGERGLVSYQITSEKPRIRMIGLADGKTYWDVPVDAQGPAATSSIDGVLQTESRIYVKVLTDLYVFAAKDGSRIAQVGSFF